MVISCKSHNQHAQTPSLTDFIFSSDDPKLRLSVHPDWEGSGLVEVFMHGQWGRVCDNEWDVHDADVVCRQLGFPGAEQSTCCGRYFGKGSGPPLMASVNCKGEESSLFNCSYVAKGGASCKQHSSAGVICKLDKPNGECLSLPSNFFIIK